MFFTNPYAFLPTIGTPAAPMGCDVRWAGSRFRPVGGEGMFASMSAAVVANNVETLALTALIPAGIFKALDTWRFWLAAVKSGLTDTGNYRVRIGPTGTTADTLVVTGAIVNVANQSTGMTVDIQFATNSTAGKIGNSAAGASSYAGQNTAPAIVPTALVGVDISTGPFFVSVFILSTGATDTVTAQACSFRWLANT